MRLVALIKVDALVLQTEPLHVGVSADFLQLRFLVHDEVLDLRMIEDKFWLSLHSRFINFHNNWSYLDLV